jgi:hypothetical protein
VRDHAFARSRPDGGLAAGAAERETEMLEVSRPFRWLVRAGFVARGITYDVIGALARLHHQTLGPWLVGLVALGLLTFAAFSLVEARYRWL